MSKNLAKVLLFTKICKFYVNKLTKIIKIYILPSKMPKNRQNNRKITEKSPELEGTEKRCIFIKIHKTNWIAMIFCCNPFFVVIGDL